MWRSYLIIALRNFRRNKFFFIISVLGLSIGLTAAILLILYIRHEYSFDRFHLNRDRIWRVSLEMERENQSEISAVATAGIGPSMLEELPEVQSVVRFSYPRGGHFLTFDNTNYALDYLTYTDSSLFEVFTFPMVSGNPATALTEPYSVVLTQSTAYKIFGGEEPVNQLVRLNDRDLLQVTGVVKDPPVNSQLRFDALVSFATLYLDTNMYLGWDGGHDYLTYILLHESADTGALISRFPDFMERHINYKYRQFGITQRLHIEPLTRVHLFSATGYDLDTRGDRNRIFITAAIALFILLIACINFMNLSTAQSVQRAREVGLRKVLGATHGTLVRQFLSEALLVSLLAFMLALVLTESVQPWFNDLTGATLGLFQSTSLGLIPAFLLLVVLTGFLAGSYPALFMARFPPERIFRGDILAGRGKPVVRNLLVVAQFFISVTLITCTLVILSQLQYLQHKSLGFRREGIMLIWLGSDASRENYTVFRNELMQLPGMIAAGAASDVPGHGFTRNGYLPEGVKDPVMFFALDADPDFLGVLDIPVVEGKGFSSGSEADREAFLINQTLARQLGWTEPVGKVISRDGRHPVAGVVADFHFAPLHEPIGPLVISRQPWGGFAVMAVRIRPENREETLQKIGAVWQKLFPNETMETEYLDRYLQSAYEPEQRFGRLFLWFSVLAVFISGIGLMGLSAYSTARRSHEIAIRKVLGAGEKAVLYRLIIDFVKWILVACVLSWPVAWILMDRWLSGFAYRTGMAVWPYIAATAIALAIGTATVAYFALRAARRNPIDGIRSE